MGVFFMNGKNDTYIAIYWLPRAGGTFIWQVLKSIFKSVASTHGSEWIGIEHPLVIVYRDARDVATSHWRTRYAKYNVEGKIINKPTKKELKEAIIITKNWLKIFYKYKDYYKDNPNVLRLRYEYFYNNYVHLFNKIESFFKITLSEGQKKEIIANTNLTINKQRANQVKITTERSFNSYDEKTRIHHSHIYTGRPGGWKEIISDNLHNFLDSELGMDLLKMGYDEFYGQHQEERIINKYISKIPKREKGKYIDIGAGDPIKLSNSYYYYLRGWNGIVIEPHSKYNKEFKKIRPKDILLRVAISDYNGKLEMCDTNTIGSFVGNYKRKKFPNKEVFSIDCITINELIKKYPEFAEPDFLNIDIESNEDKALSKCNFTVFKPQVICIEYLCPGKDDKGNFLVRMDYRKRWEHYLLPYYEFKEVLGGNAFYVRKK